MRERSFATEDPHHIGVVEPFADGGFALKSVEENRIGFHVGMGNLERDDAVVAEVGGAEDRGHAAAGDGRIDAVGIDLRSRFQGCRKSPSRVCCSSEGRLSLTVSGKRQGSSKEFR